LTVNEGQAGVSEIALYRRNTVFEDATFAQKLEAIPLHEGDRVEGQVVDISQGSALVDIGGLYAVVTLEESDWSSQEDCRRLFDEGGSYQFLVRSIDFRRDTVHLTRRFPESDPWLRSPVPALGDVVEAKAAMHRGSSCLCRTADGFEVVVPLNEVQWGIPLPIETSMPLGSTARLLVTSIDQVSRTITGSIRRLSPDPWRLIHQQLPAGSAVQGTVIAVHPAFISVQLPNGLVGYLPRQYVEDSGRDYTRFTSRMKPGARLDVLISNVFTRKQKIRLSLPPSRPPGPMVA
jgi:ribosomal protein S1